MTTSIKTTMQKATQVNRVTGYNSESPINIYVANLHDYNCGRLVGEWISLPQEEEVVEEIVARISRGYEVAIHDYECDFMEIDEYAHIMSLNNAAQIYDEFSEEERLVADAYLCEYPSANITEVVEAIERGDYTIWYDCNDMTDVAYRIVDELGLPQNIDFYFDESAFARDLRIEGYNPYDYCGCGDEDCEICNEAIRQEEEGIDYDEVVEDLLSDGCISDETKERYFDYESYGRDLDLEGHFVQLENAYVEFHG